MKLIVVDIQEGLIDEELYNCDLFLKKVKEILHQARKNGIEVMYFKHDDGEGSGFSIGDLAFEIYHKVAPKESEKVYIKTVNSCFGNKEFDEYLAKENDKELMIIGLQTEYCIDATIKQAFSKGYKVYIPKGTNSTFDNEYMAAKTATKYYYDWIWKDRFAKCITMKEAIELLNRK